MKSKYFKPTSLTWWTGVASLVTGASMLATGAGIPAAIPFILGGLGGIGMRGAIKT